MCAESLRKMDTELERALTTLLSHFDGTYNRHRYERGGMPLHKAIGVVKTTMQEVKASKEGERER